MHLRSFLRGIGQLAVMHLAATLAFADEAAKRASVPDETAQAEAMKLVKEIYGDQVAAAKDAGERSDLAKKLLAKALETQDDRASKFVLLKVGKSIAVQALDVETAFAAVDEMASAFDVDAMAMKKAVLEAVLQKAHAPTEFASLANRALVLVEQAVAQENFDLAKASGELGLDAARKSHNPQLLLHAQETVAGIEPMAKSAAAVKKALSVLDTLPDDPEANLVAGRYYCFVRNDWTKGVPMLVLGSDANLKAAAAVEVKGVASSSEQAKLGDMWWALAAKEDGMVQKAMQLRARHWYEQALPGLTGLLRDKVEKRLEDSKDVVATPQLSSPQTATTPRSRHERWVLLFRSADPSVWNTDSSDKNRYAIRVANAPEDTKFVKVQLDAKRFVVLPITKAALGDAHKGERYCWQGRNQVVWGGSDSGIFDRKIPRNNNDVCIGYEPPPLGGLSGWGFGFQEATNSQGCAWDGRPIAETVFEIYVTREAVLSSLERKHLLK